MLIKEGGLRAPAVGSVVNLGGGVYGFSSIVDTDTPGSLVVEGSADGAVIEPMLYQVVTHTRAEVMAAILALVAPDNASISATLTKVNTLPPIPASQEDVNGAVVSVVSAIGPGLTSIQDKVIGVGTSVNGVGEAVGQLPTPLSAGGTADIVELVLTEYGVHKSSEAQGIATAVLEKLGTLPTASPLSPEQTAAAVAAALAAYGVLKEENFGVAIEAIASAIGQISTLDADQTRGACMAALNEYRAPTLAEMNNQFESKVPLTAAQTKEVVLESLEDFGVQTSDQGLDHRDAVITSVGEVKPLDADDTIACARTALEAHGVATGEEVAVATSEIITAIGEISTGEGGGEGGGDYGGILAAIKESTDRIPASPASSTDYPTVADLLDASGAMSPEMLAKFQASPQIILTQLYVPTGVPEMVVPAPPESADLCLVFGYTERFTGERIAGVKVTFRLLGTPAKSERILVGGEEPVFTNNVGYFHATLKKGHSYWVTSEELGLSVQLDLTTSSFDVAELIQPGGES
ncbi:MAG: hypothetical protein EOP85_00320 [Verrucomicrobiaceae bacterium]|nr:MAG: hypothetical protein EOP85_00320 [Verrucomicrobiaceae bacterium]